MRKISILNYKGGVGKTTLATNLSHALALRGARVLLVDCDRQCNASSLLPLEKRYAPTLTQVLKGENSFSEAIRPCREGLDILPSDRDLETAANHTLVTGMRAYITLKNAVAQIDGYDFILFDHPPMQPSITDTVMLASDEMLIPCELAPFSVGGLIDMITKLGETLTAFGHQVSMTGIVPFKTDNRYTMTDIYTEELKQHFRDRVLPAVRTDAVISKAQSRGETVFEFDKNSNAAEDFMKIATLLAPKEVNQDER